MSVKITKKTKVKNILSDEELEKLKILDFEQSQETKDVPVSFRVFQSEAKKLEEFSKKKNGSKVGAFCKKLLFDAYNNEDSELIKILKSLENFESKSKEEVINLVREFQKKSIAKKEINKLEDSEISHYDYVVFLDDEIKNIEDDIIKKLEKTHTYIFNENYKIYYLYLKQKGDHKK